MSFFLDSVLEQFSISVISTNHWLVCVVTTTMDQLGIGMLFTANYLPLVLRFLQIVGGLFYPTPISTKNFAYNRIARFIFQLYMSLFIRSRRLIFWRNNVLIVKLKLQIKIMQAVRSNFGIHYPYINRLLNYYPYFLTILGLVLLQNLMGLFFYGSLIQLF